MGQINKITLNIESAFFSDVTNNLTVFGNIKVIPIIIGIVLMITSGVIIIGGLKRIAAFAEKIVPFMAVAYILGALVLVIIHFSAIPAAFFSIFRFAFGVKAVAGAAVGIAIKEVIT